MVIDIKKYKKNNQDAAIRVPLVDMIFDPEKRKAIYRKYDDKYTSTEEEDEIFEEMRGKYKSLDDRKKRILKSLANSANSEIDFNKVRDEWRKMTERDMDE